MITRSVEYVTGHEDETPRPRGRPKQVTQPYRYAGANLDSATNLYKMGARYYDPATGRFTQRDGMPASTYNPLEYNRYTDWPLNGEGVPQRERPRFYADEAGA